MLAFTTKRVFMNSCLICKRLIPIQIAKIPLNRLCSNENEDKYVVTSDPEEWKHVEVLVPESVVPQPPQIHEESPSGWVPQNPSIYSKYPYYVERTKNHMMPIYLRQKEGIIRKLTCLEKIQGDIWALEADLKEYLEKLFPQEAPLPTQVHEPGRWIRVRGIYMDQIAEFLKERGM